MRIIAGTARGRKIDAPKGMDTRPTLERVKESVFGSIQFDIYGRQVLDLFAGSGSLGIEALSRGAKQAFFCDMNRNSVAIINDNLNKLGFSNAVVYNIDYAAMLLRMKNESRVFDLVFLDPPYASGLVQNSIELLCKYKLLSGGALIVAEHSDAQNVEIREGLVLRSRKKYRETAVTILEKTGGCI